MDADSKMRKEEALPVSVNKTLLLFKPLPCNPAAETPILPLSWCSETEYSNVCSSPEECFFTDTGSTDEIRTG